MLRPQNIGTLLFDPAIASGIGRGLVSSGTPTLTSKTTTPAFDGTVGIAIVTTSTLAGTLTVEYCNATDQELILGSNQWDTYSITLPAISGATKFGIRLPNFEFGRLRLKFVVSSGTGTILAQLCVKGV